jgi:uncharacterized protein YjbJ (UPF0337 family)
MRTIDADDRSYVYGNVPTFHFEGGIMNRDQVNGRVKEAVGKVQTEAGKATGSVKQQAKGLGKQAVGKVQKTVGDARNEERKGRT